MLTSSLQLIPRPTRKLPARLWICQGRKTVLWNFNYNLPQPANTWSRSSGYSSYVEQHLPTPIFTQHSIHFYNHSQITEQIKLLQKQLRLKLLMHPSLDTLSLSSSSSSFSFIFLYLANLISRSGASREIGLRTKCTAIYPDFPCNRKTQSAMTTDSPSNMPTITSATQREPAITQ